jgi:hypothetical protein
MHVPAKMNQEPFQEWMMVAMIGGSHIHFPTKFEYLGSEVTSEPSHNIVVKTRIIIENSQMGQVKELFRYKDISRSTKKFIYHAIQRITIL